MAIDETLDELAGLLYGMNYSVFLRRYPVPFQADAGADWYVAQAVGPTAVTGGTSKVTATEVLTEVEELLRHAGDHAYGPDASFLQSAKYTELLSRVLAYVEQATAEATLIEWFWLKEGHPYCSVYWDFAYVFAGPLEAEVFIGSSSD